MEYAPATVYASTAWCLLGVRCWRELVGAVWCALGLRGGSGGGGGGGRRECNQKKNRATMWGMNEIGSYV